MADPRFDSGMGGTRPAFKVRASCTSSTRRTELEREAWRGDWLQPWVLSVEAAQSFHNDALTSA
jgi:hypothetical protein